MAGEWFAPSTPALSQLGATFGGGGGSSAQPAAGSASTALQQQNVDNYLKNQKNDADRSYNLKKKELDQQRDIAKAQAKTAQQRNEIDKWYNQQQVQLAQQRLTQEGQQFTQRLDFDKQTQAQNFGLSQAKLGYDVLGMAANLRGPANYYQAANFNRGVANDPNSAVFLNALKNNINLPNFTAQGGIPDPETLGTLTAKLGTPIQSVGAIGSDPSAIAGTAANQADATLAQIRGIGAEGAHKLSNGALEQLTDTERKLLTSGLDASGFDTASFLDSYRRSRVSQGTGNRNAA